MSLWQTFVKQNLSNKFAKTNTYHNFCGCDMRLELSVLMSQCDRAQHF